MAKVILIDPRGSEGGAMGNTPYPNVGIAYLVASLEANKHEVQVIDLNNEILTDEELFRIILNFQPELVGFSAKTATIRSAANLARSIKNLFPHLPIIVGGPHTKLAWQELILESCFDIVFVGEGEQILPIICNYMEEDKPIEHLPGIITKRNYVEIQNLTRPLLSSSELNALSFPVYDKFPVNVKESLQTAYPLLTSRGCVYDCIYCCVPEISGKIFRKRSPESVVKEVKWAKKKYDITMFRIIDDVFNLDMKRCKQICYALIEADLGMKWMCLNGLRADRVDKELTQLMYMAGCRYVMVGIESADPAVFNSINKGETIEDIERGIRLFKEAGINVGGYFMIGLPGDSLKSEKLSLEFAKRNAIDSHFNMLVPYTGTKLWKWAKENARFLTNIEDGLHYAQCSDIAKPVIETKDFSALDRQRAYEMVNTRLGHFKMLIPAHYSRWEKHIKAIQFMWKYDRYQLPIYIFKNLSKKLTHMIKKLFS